MICICPHLLTDEYRYGAPFIEHSFTYHLTRIDHRHNFSIYNTVLHLSSAAGSLVQGAGLRIESIAFVPQILLALILIPLLLAKKDLPSTMLAQTFAFVTFNKVCTSQVSDHLDVQVTCGRRNDYSF
jgi:phosphatidylinositol glycan class M